LGILTNQNAALVLKNLSGILGTHLFDGLGANDFDLLCGTTHGNAFDGAGNTRRVEHLQIMQGVFAL
jgi:hypothetical protein